MPVFVERFEIIFTKLHGDEMRVCLGHNTYLGTLTFWHSFRYHTEDDLSSQQPITTEESSRQPIIIYIIITLPDTWHRHTRPVNWVTETKPSERYFSHFVLIFPSMGVCDDPGPDEWHVLMLRRPGPVSACTGHISVTSHQSPTHFPRVLRLQSRLWEDTRHCCRLGATHWAMWYLQLKCWETRDWKYAD